MIRAPLWLIGALLVAAILVGVYAYYTTPLPLGLSSIIRTPGGVGGTAEPAPTIGAAGSSSGSGQSLVLGVASVSVQSVLRNQDLATTQGGPPGVFALLEVQLVNAGTQPLSPTVSDFRLLDDAGRSYAVDAEATRAANAFAHRRDVFDASVPPGSTVLTTLAFEVPATAMPTTLRVNLGYGDLALPR